MDRISSYAHKCHILRQIQSNKARRFALINAVQNTATVTITSFLMFIGFSGIEKVTGYLNWIVETDQERVELGFNFLVFLLFVVAILHLVFQFHKKQADAERAIVDLTNLANEIDDRIAASESGLSTISNGDVDLVRHKYESLLQIIPANSDREFLRAKRDYQAKEGADLHSVRTEILDSKRLNGILIANVRTSPQVMQILGLLRELDTRLHLGGGIVRNLIWDRLHGYRNPTPIDDVDIVYFDPGVTQKPNDEALEQRLQRRLANLRWSVKNQARMHNFSGDSPYSSLADAIKNWPETATAFALRLNDEGDIEIVAPYGFDDLFRLLVVPTPRYMSNAARVRERVEKKKWQETWPRLRVILCSAEG